MNTRKTFLSVVLSLLCIAAAVGLSAQSTPKVTISPARVQHEGHVELSGTGFTPKRNVSSHLRRPDGTEFPVLPFLTDDRGAFIHDIDTLLLSPGVHDVWVVDDASKTTSNVAHFEVTAGPPK